MRRALVVAIVALAAVAAAHATPPPQRILLPSVRTPLAPGPPLLGKAAILETRFPGHIASGERVRVGVDATGAPVSISVLQELLIPRLGDYTFGVAGPIADVAAAPGSDSEPGLRTDAIVWSGFSAGNKRLAADATLRVPEAAPLLPLRIRRSGSTVVLENATAAPASLLAGPVFGRDARTALVETARPLVPDRYVRVPRLPRTVSARVVAPLALRGSIGGVRVETTLTGRLVVHAPASAKLHLVVTPVRPARAAAPEGGLLEAVSRARATVARVLQYGQFLANPDPNGSSHASYVYASASGRPPRVVPQPPADDGGAWATVAIAAACVLGAGALAVLWAHS
jgi:hypothetical protein